MIARLPLALAGLMLAWASSSTGHTHTRTHYTFIYGRRMETIKIPDILHTLQDATSDTAHRKTRVYIFINVYCIYTVYEIYSIIYYVQYTIYIVNIYIYTVYILYIYTLYIKKNDKSLLICS